MSRFSPAAVRGLAVFGVAAAILAALIWIPVRPSRTEPPFDVLAAVPRDAALLVRFDVKRLARSRSALDWRRIAPEIPGGKSLATTCRTDPFRTLDRLVLLVRAPREKGADMEIGLVATGAISEHEVLDCARRVLEARGQTAVQSRIDAFGTVRSRDGTEVEVAARDGGPLLVGSGAVLRNMIDSARGAAPSVRGTAHERLLARLAQHAIAASFIPRTGWLNTLADPDVAARSPLATVKSMAVGIDVEPVSRLTADLSCSDPDAAQRVHHLLTGLRETLGPWLHEELGIARDASTVKVQQSRVQVTVSLGSEAIEHLLSAAFGGGSVEPRVPSTPASASAPIAPHQTLIPAR